MGDTAPMDFYRPSVVYSPKIRDLRRISPRLPTPEASRSSNGSLDEQIPRTYIRNGMRICSLLSSDRSDCGDDSAGQSREGLAVYDDRQHRSRPRSPLYQPADCQKPSLPPLKTVRNMTALLGIVN